MLAITWSVPRPTKHITGNQMETILEIISREEMARKTAMQTSQLPGCKVLVSVIGDVGGIGGGIGEEEGTNKECLLGRFGATPGLRI